MMRHNADDGFDAFTLARFREANGAVESVVIGERQGRHAQFRRATRKVLRKGCPVEEGERRMTVQLYVSHSTTSQAAA